MHECNEKIFIVNKSPFIVDLVVIEVPQKKKWKYVQFVTIYQLFFTSGAMTNFKDLEDLFLPLNIKHTSQIHWNDWTNWGIVESMNNLLLQSTLNVIVVVNFIFVNVDEVIMINNIFWISIHLYVVHGWKRIPLLIYGKKVDVQKIGQNVFIFIVKMLMTLGGGNVEKLKSKLSSIGFHGNNVFQGSQVGVTTLMKEIMASFMIKMHCLVH